MSQLHGGVHDSTWYFLGQDCKSIYKNCIPGQGELMLLEKLSMFTSSVLWQTIEFCHVF